MTDIATASNPAATEARVAAARRGAGVAVLVPCYNEAVTIAKVVRDFREALPEATVYVYDNNSTDGTAELAAAAGAVVRRESRQGKGNVVRSMFRDVDAEVYLMVDGDDTYPASAAGELVAPIAADEADMTVGDRLSNGSYGKENDRPFHGFGNDLVRWLIRLIYGYSFDDVMTGYRAFSRAFVKTMPVMSAGFQVETEISIWAVDRRWRVADVPVDYRDRPEGSVSKLSTVGDGMLVLAAIASLFRDYRPMAFFGWLSLVLVALGLLAGLPVVGDWLETGLVPRLPSAVLAIALVLCGALSATAGLILDTVAKSHRRQWELSVYQVMEDNGR
ncbi:glycosyltransferase family 2 protein [Adlercreutzia mucosicola]|uniref:Glycosyltransferase n=1 Tax=Adlercreutzia mucosicola TaxID=580026 RepID=A0A6N8JRP2_9ACTN|nr:glycosyltransferase family 2 protein [Adlercreutzia mucosicola]MCI9494361.1 glycosyltransferase [Adlercreutzia mucosicola]MEB1812839.1 glycosyltransferase family 2 protein [Adlercreutzia mucosicola]MVX61827.1 glycosyltransferase [Adlercreutzia mucosicola]